MLVYLLRKRQRKVNKMSNEIWVVAAKRTPIGAFQGALATTEATALGAKAIEAALETSQLDKNKVDEVLMGCVLTAAVGQAPARQAALGAGLPQSVGATTLNKVCGSGMKTVMLACDLIKSGAQKLWWRVVWKICPHRLICSVRRETVIVSVINRSLTICFTTVYRTLIKES